MHLNKVTLSFAGPAVRADGDDRRAVELVAA